MIDICLDSVSTRVTPKGAVDGFQQFYARGFLNKRSFNSAVIEADSACLPTSGLDLRISCFGPNTEAQISANATLLLNNV
jgi:hypothetical protein